MVLQENQLSLKHSSHESIHTIAAALPMLASPAHSPVEHSRKAPIMANIIVIEDNVQSSRMISRLLRKAGHNVVVADTGEGGLLAVFESLPDLVLIDLGLPDIDGQTVIAVLRQQPASAKIPVIAFTACPEATANKIATAYGCNGLITKPVDTQTVVSQIEHFLPSNLKGKHNTEDAAR